MLKTPSIHTLPVVVATIATIVVGSMTADLKSQEQERPRRRAAEERAEGRDREDGERTRPQLGIVVAPSPGGSPLVLRVIPGSPADQAGIRPGDYILSLDGKKIKSPEQLQKSLRRNESAGQAKFTIWRSGKQHSREVDLAPRRRPSEGQLGRRAWLGVMIRAAGDAGVEITRIYLDSPADKAGLKAGDRIRQVDGEAVSSPEVVTDRVGQLEPGETVNVHVERDGEEMTVEVEVGNLEDFHERLFGKRFRRKFDDFHQMFDPDFDGVPERVFSFRIPAAENDGLRLREMLRDMREELREFRREFRASHGNDRQSTSGQKSGKPKKEPGKPKQEPGKTRKKSGKPKANE